MNLGYGLRKWLGNDPNGTGFIRVPWKRCHVKLQSRKCILDQEIIVLKNGAVHHGLLINIPLFMNSSVFLQKGLQNEP